MKKELICKILLAGTDLFLCFVSLFVALGLLKWRICDVHLYLPQSQFDNRVFVHFIVSAACVIWFFLHLRHYTHRKPFWFEMRDIIVTLLIFAVIEMAIVAFSKLHISRYLWILTWIIALVLVPMGRIVARNTLRTIGISKLDTIIIGSHKNALDAYLALQGQRYLALNITHFIGEQNIDLLSNISVPIIADGDNLLKDINKDTTQFILALEEDEFELRNEWLRKLAKYRCRMVTVVPTIRGLPLYGTDISFIFSHDVMMLRLKNNLARLSSRVLKRTMDIVCAILIILMLSPLLLILFVMISKDGGHAIYGHARIGRERKTFKCYKFRSMVVNSNEVLDNLLTNDPLAKQEWEKDFKLKNDPRITKIGNFIRRTSLDELPQLFNVLKGDMSLVGPRPIVEEELQRYDNDLDYYLMAKPGMTGLWQVSGRNDVDYETRVYFDSWYVKNWSIWNDIVILFKTVGVVLKRSGAY